MKFGHHTANHYGFFVLLLFPILIFVCSENNDVDVDVDIDIDVDVDFEDFLSERPFSPCPLCTDNGSHSRVVEWILLNGGHLNPKQEVRYIGCEVPSSNGYGVFAVEDIDEGEILTRIPNNLVISNTNDDYCALLGEFPEVEDDESSFTPYIDHIFSLEAFMPLELWDFPGIRMLFKIVGLNLPPTECTQYFKDMLIEFVVEKCEIEMNPPAVIYFINLMDQMFGDNLMLVPFADFYNHRRGKWSNVNHPIIDDDGTVTFIASKPIKAGDQLYLDIGKKHDFSTPEYFLMTGSIEDYPQKWIIGENLKFIVDRLDIEPQATNIEWLSPPPSFHDILFLEKELERLKKLSKENEIMKIKDDICDVELDRAWQYYDALLVAINGALKASNKSVSTSWEQDQIYVQSHDIDYSVIDSSCVLQNGLLDRSDIIDYIESPYQELTFFQIKGRNELCFSLDDLVHTCASFRPSMHEVYVHYPIAYLKSLRRVVFLGGGDSMVLHEILKYSSVEYILGIELDQEVTRKSFEHFHTQPHFDDQRVHWIYGDATKALKVIPKDYFESFDLVIADLTQDVMNLPVSGTINLLNVASLLTKKDGIFIVNDNMMDSLGNVFKYTMELHFENHPIYCQQVFILGSHENNLTKPNFQLMQESKVVNKFYNPLMNPKDHYAPIYSYYENSSLGYSKLECSPFFKNEINNGGALQYGLVTIFDIENSSLSTLSIEQIDWEIRALAESLGMTGITSASHSFDNDDNTFNIIILDQGYIMIHTLRKFRYSAIDVNIWDKLEVIDELKNDIFELADTSKSGPISQFSILVGNNFVSDTSVKENDILDGIDCIPEFSHESKELSSDEASRILIEESSILVDDEDGISVILCGDINAGCCNYLDSLGSYTNYTVVIGTSSAINEECTSGQTTTNGIKKVFLHEQTLEDALQMLVVEEMKISFLYIDPNISPKLMYSIEKIIVQKAIKDSIFASNFVVAMARNESLNNEMRHLLRRLRTIGEDFGTLVNTMIDYADGRVEIGVFACGKNTTSSLLHDYFATIKSKYGYYHFTDTKFKSNIPEYPVAIDYDLYKYSVQDYDIQPGYDQFSNQQQLGAQVLLKVELKKSFSDYERANTQRDIINMLEDIFLDDDIQIEIQKSDFSRISIMYVMSSYGQLIATWDGFENIEVNFFTEDFESSLANLDVLFTFFETTLNVQKIVYYGSQPRGIGRVVTRTTTAFSTTE